MKKSKYLKKIDQETSCFCDIIKNYTDKVMKDYKKMLIASKNELISTIAEGENLDELNLREKYLKPCKKKNRNKITEQGIDDNEEKILDRVILEGKTYYYENKSNGLVYNDKSKLVGKYVNNAFNFC